MFDAVIVGAGHNGLAAAVLLARAGWKVLVLEAQAAPGGAVKTEELTIPGFRHDVFATNLNAFAASAFAAEFRSELEGAGFELCRASSVFCSVFPDGDCVGVTRSLDETLADIGRLSPRDAKTWQDLIANFKNFGPRLLGAMRAPMPSRKGLTEGLRNLPLICQSSGAFVRKHFEDAKVRALWAVWGMHLDFPPSVPGGALYPYMQCVLTQANGLTFGKGGARNMVDAMVSLLHRFGGELRCSTPVSAISLQNGRAVSVICGGESIPARRAVIANLAPSVLYRLLKRELPKRYRHGPGTMMIHLAASELPRWRDFRARQFAYVHIGPTLDAMTTTYHQALRGELPQEPVMIVAQPTVVDPSRAPAGKHILSIQVRVVPSRADWDSIKEGYADRLLELLERYAPGLRASIMGRRVFSPLDLERANANLVGGDHIGGSHHLDQQFVFRPFFGWWHYRTPFESLFMCGASTWPGGGVGAASGYLLGKRLVAQAA